MRITLQNFNFCFILIFFFGLSQNSVGQQIFVDEDYSDWSSPIYTDSSNDGSQSGVDLRKIFIANDDDHLYISFEIDSKIVLQNYFGLSLYIDTDNNSATGNQIHGIGAEISYPFDVNQDKFFRINNSNFQIRHADLGLFALPSVSSDRFEIRIDRALNIAGNSIDLNSDIKIVLADLNGDILPDTAGGVAYQMNDNAYSSTVNLERIESDDLRIMSLNVERDGYFENGPREAINRIIRALNPDIIAFQEIYDHTADQTEIQVATALNVSSSNLYSARVFPDIIVVSKFPIDDVGAVGGNGFFKIRLTDRDLLLVNCHLACCDNDDQRDEEVEEILEYLNNAKNGTATVTISEDSPIVILGDMNFVGKSEQPEDLINGQGTGPDWGDKMEDAKPLCTGDTGAYTWYKPSSSFHPGRLDYVIYSGSVLKLKNRFNLFTPTVPAELLDSYDLLSSDSENASDHLAVIVDFDKDKISSAGETVLNDWKIYPNPTSNIISIGGNIDLIEIHDTSGRLIMRSHYPFSKMDISRLSAGNYVITRFKEGKPESLLFQKR